MNRREIRMKRARKESLTYHDEYHVKRSAENETVPRRHATLFRRLVQECEQRNHVKRHHGHAHARHVRPHRMNWFQQIIRRDRVHDIFYILRARIERIQSVFVVLSARMKFASPSARRARAERRAYLRRERHQTHTRDVDAR